MKQGLQHTVQLDIHVLKQKNQNWIWKRDTEFLLNNEFSENSLQSFQVDLWEIILVSQIPFILSRKGKKLQTIH